MQLSTPVHIAPSARRITYDDRLLFLGSCFADSVSTCMQSYYFRIVSNPFGTLYNPISIAQAIHLLQPSPLIEWGGLFHSMDHHGSFSSRSYDETLALTRRSISTMQQSLADSSVLCITFGTAWVYELDGRVVANCHKMPPSRFTRRRLTPQEIVQAWLPILRAYPDKHFIFTVSPIRHLKDGAHENQLSKSTLLLSIDELLRESSRTSYFPSYEIMLDELRDYRFYAEDMIHPSDQAVRYIFSRFVETYMDDTTRLDMKQLHHLYLDRQHRFLHPDSIEAVAFLKHIDERTAALHTRFPWI